MHLQHTLRISKHGNSWKSQILKRDKIYPVKQNLEGKVVYICSKCSFLKNTCLAVVGHINKKHLEMHLKCGKCSYKMYNPDAFRKHVTVCGKTFPCPQCHKNMLNVSALNRHLLVHSQPKYKCDSCGLLHKYKWCACKCCY